MYFSSGLICSRAHTVRPYIWGIVYIWGIMGILENV